MRFDSASIYMVRDLYGDESLRGAVRMLAVSDSSLVVNSLIQCIGLEELDIELISADSDIAAHCERSRPDIIMMNIAMLGEDYLAELTVRLRNLFHNTHLPHLIIVGSPPPPDVFDIYAHYPDCYSVVTPTAPFTEGESLRRHIVGSLIGYDFYREKLKHSAEQTLRGMHASSTRSGFEYLLDEVMIVLENPYVNIGTALNLHRAVAELRGVSHSAIDLAIRPIIKDAIGSFSDNEYRICFTEYITRKVRPSELEFVFAAAKITSLSCPTLLKRLLDDPTPTIRGKIKIV